MQLAWKVEKGSKVRLKHYDPNFVDPHTDRALAAAQHHCLLIVLQGMGTSGKDGTIRHVMAQINPLGCEVRSFKGPTTREQVHDFLWRIHRVVPGRGLISIFNRSHYEDVLVVLGREQEALGLAELLTDRATKAHILITMAQVQERQQKGEGSRKKQERFIDLLMRAFEVAGTTEDSVRRASSLCELGVALAQAQEKERAQAVWAEAERVISTIEGSYSRADALHALGAVLINSNKHLQLLRLVQRSNPLQIKPLTAKNSTAILDLLIGKYVAI